MQRGRDKPKEPGKIRRLTVSSGPDADLVVAIPMRGPLSQRHPDSVVRAARARARREGAKILG
jgi:hypothetical protein